jgi:serine/threonine protein kinase/HD-like signal output (HDOD) protein
MTAPTGSGGAQPEAGPESLFGSQVGPYRIRSLLGEGGMGVVYLAEHELIGRKAAIKMLAADVAGDSEAVSRFFLEARTVNQIRHPNIVDVTDLGHHNTQPYIVMEYLEGETLADRLKRAGPMDSTVALKVTRQVASALGAVHEHGLVHRDLKPANIFICAHPDYPDFTKVLDFGIAKLVSVHEDVGHKTRAGALLGTPQYMSPEQCLGQRDIDPRSDIYSLGVVLYAMLTGRLPFANRPFGQLIVAHVMEIPGPPHLLNPTIVPALSALVMKMLEKRREDRPASMFVLRDSIDSLLGIEHEIPGVPIMPLGSDATGPIGLAAAAFADEGHTGEMRARLLAVNLEATETSAGNFPDDDFDSETSGSPGSLEPISGVMGGPVRALPDHAILVERVTDFIDERLAADKIPLPVLSRASAQCLELMRLPGFSFADLSEAMMREPNLARRIVAQSNRVVGSTSTQRVVGIAQAVRRIGAAGMQRTLVEMAARPAFCPPNSRFTQALKRPWYHAIATALLAERIGSNAQLPQLEPITESLYIAGLLHSIGRCVLANFLLTSERRIARRYELPRLPWAALLDAADAASIRVSVAVARAWNLPEDVVGMLASCGLAGSRTDDGAAAPSAAVVLRLAHGIAIREGFVLRDEDKVGVSNDIRASRMRLGLDESGIDRMLFDLQNHVARLARTRGE